MKTYLTEAFQQMELIESNEFTFDNKGATELANFMDADMLDDFEAIIDPEATNVEELKDSYIGNVVCECQICKSKIYKDPEDIKIDTDDAELANVGECCPYCFETDGFKIIGQIAPYEEVTVETNSDATDVTVEVDGDMVEIETDDEKMTGRHAKDNEDLEDSQRFPVEGTKQVDLTEARKKSRRHAKDNEDLEDSQRYPIKSPVGTKGLKESNLRDKLKGAVPDLFTNDTRTLQDKIKDLGITIKDVEAVKDWLNSMPASTNRVKLQSRFPELDLDAAQTEIDNLNSWRKQEPRLAVEIRKLADGDLDALIAEMKKLGLTESVSEETEQDKKLKLARKMRLARHKKDNEDLEDSQRYPIESPAPAQTGLAMMEGMSVRDKLEKAFPGVFNFSEKKEESLKENREDQELSKLGYKIVPVQKGHEAVLALMDTSTSKRVAVPDHLDLYDTQAVIDYVKTNLKSQMQESLKEGMEDISITTDDQVIKVKATPRADKEAIQPVTDDTKDVIENEEAADEKFDDSNLAMSDEDVARVNEPFEEPFEETEETDVNITDFDEKAFDELGESYLKEVYDNVESFRTTDGSVDGNTLMLEGIIKFTSGKSAKTKFVFEAKTITKTGKVKLTGVNEQITKNKNAFTLTGRVSNAKLLSESLNYNYGARSNGGKVKRLYGTVKVSK